MDGCQTSAIVAGLESMADYDFYVVGVDANGNTAATDGNVWCAAVRGSTNKEAFCSIPTTEFSIISNMNTSFGDRLFDEQDGQPNPADIDLCDLVIGNTDTPMPITDWYSTSTNNASAETVIEFVEPYQLDAIYFYDGNDTGEFSVFYGNSPTGPWLPTTIHEYNTIPYNKWQFYTGVTPPNTPIRFLRFVASDNGVHPAKINEVFLCGEPVKDTSTEDCKIIKLSAEEVKGNCGAVNLEWATSSATDCEDIIRYNIHYIMTDDVDNCPLAPPSNASFTFAGGQDNNLTIDNLEGGACYCFYIQGVNSDFIPTNIEPTSVCLSDCGGNGTCDCESFIELVHEKHVIFDPIPVQGVDWIFNSSIPGSNQPDNMFDEQDFIHEICKTDICGENPIEGQGVPITEWLVPWLSEASVTMTFIDGPYLVSGIYIFDTNSEGKISFEGETSAGEIINFTPGTPHITENYINWCQVYDGVEVELMKLTVSKENAARFSELALCGTKKGRGGKQIQPLLAYPDDPEFFPIVYPNPNTGIMKIGLKDGRYNHVQIYNTLGQPVQEEVVTEENQVLDLGLLSPGIYWFRFTGERVRPYSTKVFIVKEDY